MNERRRFHGWPENEPPESPPYDIVSQMKIKPRRRRRCELCGKRRLCTEQPNVVDGGTWWLCEPDAIWAPSAFELFIVGLYQAGVFDGDA